MINAHKEATYQKDNREYNVHCINQIFNNITINVSPHYHEYIEILYGIDCDMSVWINDHTFNLKNGDLMIINYDETHTLSCNKEYNHYYVIKFMPYILDNLRGFPNVFRYAVPLADDFIKTHIIKKDEIKNSRIFQNIADIFTEWNDEKFGFEASIHGHLICLYNEIMRIWHQNEVFSNMEFGTPNDNLVYSAAEYCKNNYSTINEKDIADHFSVSYSYFSRVFKRVMGIGFAEYITNIKLDEARKMLLTTNKSITDIACELNFSSSSHFNTVFKKRTNLSPSNYRKAHNSVINNGL